MDPGTSGGNAVAALMKVFQHAFIRGEFEMAGIVGIFEAEDGHGFDVKVDWV